MNDFNNTSEFTEPSNRKDFAMRAVFIVIMVAAALVLVYSIYNIVAITSEDSANEHTMDAMREFVLTSEEEEGEDASPDSTTAPARTVDFASLTQINPEIVGWLYIPGTNVDYPVTHTDNNDFYLSHGPDLEENRAGSIFFEAACSPDLSDQNTIIYGHRMNNGSMFGSINQFEDPDFFNAHRTVYLYTADGVQHEYKLYSIIHSSDSMDSPAYLIQFDSPEAFASNCRDIEEASLVPTGDVNIQSSDHVLTLSTCVKGDHGTRLVMQAVKVV